MESTYLQRQNRSARTVHRLCELYFALSSAIERLVSSKGEELMRRVCALRGLCGIHARTADPSPGQPSPVQAYAEERNSNQAICDSF